MQNLERSFPEKDEKEIKKIAKAFYKHLCDLLVEGIKGFSMSKSTLHKRYKFKNPELMREYYDKGISVVSVGAHYGNWEWGIIIVPTEIQHKLYAFYTPISNKHLERYITRERNKLGSHMINLKELRNAFRINYNEPVTLFFGADQNPSNPNATYWMTFLNQETGCLLGPEYFARRYKMPVVYYDVQRVKRGYYEVELKKLEEHPENTKPGELTEKYMRFVESIVRKKPENYLWSHRRWKHKRRGENKIHE
jgi:KDO2-lipid IV(A) lauroyltransferase